jgi:hypothetical protein
MGCEINSTTRPHSGAASTRKRRCAAAARFLILAMTSSKRAGLVNRNGNTAFFLVEPRG